MHIDIEARQPAWVAITDASGKRLMAKTLEANETHTLELTAGATLRTGNAGGLVVRFNGKEIGPLGPVGKIRDISFKNGAYKDPRAGCGVNRFSFLVECEGLLDDALADRVEHDVGGAMQI